MRREKADGAEDRRPEEYNSPLAVHSGLLMNASLLFFFLSNRYESTHTFRCEESITRVDFGATRDSPSCMRTCPRLKGKRR